MAALRGRGGVSLLDAWNGSPRAYLGTAVAGFPNMFFLVGPNSAGGYNSIIFTSESHINYAARAIREMERANVATVEVRPDVYDAFNRDTERRLGESVWNQGGCASWYIDANGRNGVWWPGFTVDLWRRTAASTAAAIWPSRPEREAQSQRACTSQRAVSWKMMTTSSRISRNAHNGAAGNQTICEIAFTDTKKTPAQRAAELPVISRCRSARSASRGSDGPSPTW